MNGKNTARKMKAREDATRDPRKGLAGTAGSKPALVVAIGTAPTLKSPTGRANNRTAQKIRK